MTVVTAMAPRQISTRRRSSPRCSNQVISPVGGVASRGTSPRSRSRRAVNGGSIVRRIESAIWRRGRDTARRWLSPLNRSPHIGHGPLQVLARFGQTGVHWIGEGGGEPSGLGQPLGEATGGAR